jgi:hypothetical protein
MTSTDLSPMKLKLKRRHSRNTPESVVNSTLTESDKSGDKLDFDGRPINLGAGAIKLNLVRKPTISPLLSIQTYIYNNIRDNIPLDNIRELWDKYEKQSIHSSLIQIHNLDYEIFKDIAMTILDSITPYQISIRPDYGYDTGPRISNHDLIDFEL